VGLFPTHATERIVSTFSEDNNVQADQLVQSDGFTRTHSIKSPEGALTENSSALASDEATATNLQSITASINGQEFLLQDAGSTAPAPTLGRDLTLNHGSETISANKPMPSDESATNQLKVQVPETSARSDRDSMSEIPIPNIEPTSTHDLVREKTGKRPICVAVVDWDEFGPKLTRSGAIRFQDKWRTVPKLLPALSESVILPTDLEDYGTTRDLFDSIRDLLGRYLTLFKHQDELLAYWCIASWFPDVLDFIPRLTITGPRSASDLLFRVLRTVSRRPVLLAGINSAVLKAIPINELMPTLLIRETRLSSRKLDLLDASDQKDYFVATGAELRQFYCAKCIYLGEDRSDQAGAPGGIHVHVGDIRSFAFQVLPDYEVESFQNKLFRYRSLHYDRVKLSKFTAEGLLPELRAMAQQLGSAIVDDDALQRRITDVLKEQSEQARVDRSSGRQAIVLRAVLFHCHQSDQQQVFAREISATVNRIYSEEGESLKVSSETVGRVLKSMGLYSRRLGNAGRGLILDKPTQTSAHELSHAYDVLPEVPACGYCYALHVPQSKEIV
jgi:hypothetical protein